MNALDQSFAALADPTRRALIARLAQGEATVQDLARPFAISQPAISRHLKVLEEAGLIETRIDGTARPRRLKPERLRRSGIGLASTAPCGRRSFSGWMRCLTPCRTMPVPQTRSPSNPIPPIRHPLIRHR